MGLVEAILEGSSLVREVKEKAAQEAREAGMAEGLEKGLEQGSTDATRRALRTVLKSRFPGLDAMPEIETIANTETLQSVLELAIVATDRTVIERAITNQPAG